MRLLPLLLLFVAASAQAAIYRWVDPSGTVVYSDKPVKGAKKIEVPPPPSFHLPPAPAAPAVKSKPKSPPYYHALEIQAPADDQAMWDNAGNLRVRFHLAPPLRVPLGDHVEILVDGQPRVQTTASEIELRNLDRGTHRLQVRVVDGAGRVLIRSAEIHFHLHRQSVLFPQRRRFPTGTTPAPAR